MEDRTWQLRRGEEEIGRLTLEAVDMFWHDCRFEASAGWVTVSPLIEESRRAWERGDTETALKLDEAIDALDLELVPNSEGEPITDFLLRIDMDAGSARFRY
ncbi:hypothetical protein ACWCQ0_01085 [Streptomyces massasporeus]|uniref:hypothetical protein n=1 Tax=Streptomyces massasporeus TaxID=67324 RepID=UPI0033C5B4C3